MERNYRNIAKTQDIDSFSLSVIGWMILNQRRKEGQSNKFHPYQFFYFKLALMYHRFLSNVYRGGPHTCGAYFGRRSNRSSHLCERAHPMKSNALQFVRKR